MSFYGVSMNSGNILIVLLLDSNVLNENSNSSEDKSSICDGNQNVNSLSNITTLNVDSKLLKKAIKNLKNSFIDLMKEKEKSLANETHENIKGRDEKSLTEDLEKQIATLKQELDSRPCLNDYKEKVELLDELNDKLTLSETENLAFKLELNNNKAKLSSLQQELESSKKAAESEKPSTLDVTIQTEVFEVFEERVTVKVESKSDESLPNSDTTVNDVESELKLIHHPDLQREEELVAFKEKYSKLVEEKIAVDKELMKLREDYLQFRQKSFVHLLLYLAPLIALLSYLMFYFIK